MEKDISNISIENAKIVFCNFAGKETRFNPAGRRNFCVLIEPIAAQKLINDGWNIKYLKAREPGDLDQPYLQVAVNYEHIAPKVWIVNRKGKTLLDEDSIAVIDYAEKKNVDVIIRPYKWEVNGKSGIKAYLKTMYVTIMEDEFAHKYETSGESTDYSNFSEEDLPF